MVYYFPPPHPFCPYFVFLKSNLGYRRPDEPEAHFTDENSSFGVRTLHCWEPTEPSDSTIHS